MSQEEHDQVILQMQKLQSRHANTIIGPSSNAPMQPKSKRPASSSTTDVKKTRNPCTQSQLKTAACENQSISELMQRYSKMPTQTSHEVQKKSRNSQHQACKTVTQNPPRASERYSQPSTVLQPKQAPIKNPKHTLQQSQVQHNQRQLTKEFTYNWQEQAGNKRS